jgi:hypothetical protein
LRFAGQVGPVLRKDALLEHRLEAELPDLLDAFVELVAGNELAGATIAVTPWRSLGGFSIRSGELPHLFGDQAVLLRPMTAHSWAVGGRHSRVNRSFA